jgi:hypothetical protein
MVISAAMEARLEQVNCTAQKFDDTEGSKITYGETC